MNTNSHCIQNSEQLTRTTSVVQVSELVSLTVKKRHLRHICYAISEYFLYQ